MYLKRSLIAVNRINKQYYRAFAHDRHLIYSGYATDSLSVLLNLSRNDAMQSAYNKELQQQESLMINGIQNEVYRRVINDISKNIQIDSSQLSNAIYSGISSAIKSIGA